MTCNVGGVDRVLRTILGVALLLAALLAPLDTAWRIVLVALAAIALLTAAVRFCPLNRLIGLDTCRG